MGEQVGIGLGSWAALSLLVAAVWSRAGQVLTRRPRREAPGPLPHLDSTRDGDEHLLG